MKNNTLWIVLALILIALGVWWFTGNGDTTNNGTSNTNNTANNTSATSSQTSIKALLATGRPVSCTFDNADSGKGTVYVSGNQMRADYVAEGTTGHMINDGQFVYVWADGIAQGFKMSATVADLPAATEAPDLNQEQDLDCSAWSPVVASFTPPANVTFSTMPGAQ